MPTPRNWTPTPRRDWVVVGDRCISAGSMEGVVLARTGNGTPPTVLVKWSNGHEGRITITQVRKLPT
jgi:hypothetical protein